MKTFPMFGDRQICLTCSKPQELSQFMKGEERVSQCQQCRHDGKVEKKQQARQAAKSEALAKLNKALNAKQINVPHISEVAAAVLNEVGGLKEFARLYVEDLKAARLKSPGSKTILDADHRLVTLLNLSTEHRSTAPDTDFLSDEDLDRELEKLIADQLPRVYEPTDDGSEDVA